MADNKTANEWKQSATTLNAQIDKLQADQDNVADKISQLTQQQIKLLGVTRNLPAGSAERNAANKEYGELTSQIQQLTSQKNQLSQQIVDIDSQVQAAERQAGIANAAVDDTKKNTPPANSNPGNNTDVATTSEPSSSTGTTAQSVDSPTNNNTTENPNLVRSPAVEETSPVTSTLSGQSPSSGPLPPAIQIPDELSQRASAGESASTPAVSEAPADEPYTDPNQRIDITYQITGRYPGIQKAPLPVLTSDLSVTGDIPVNIAIPPVVPAEEPQTPFTAEDLQPGRTGVNPPAPPPAPRSPPPIIATKKISDWRFRISLSDKAEYFYNIAERGHLLHPLKATNGVIFPYTPDISVSYVANYEPTEITHSNYRIHNYKSSAIENITINGEFTAQDSVEAEYVLAVIHFFRCATKMFYGKDTSPKAGTPPPLCYMSGHGTYGFDNHPIVITNFTLSYPNDVDYISTGDNTNYALPTYNKPIIGQPTRLQRLMKSGLKPEGSAVSASKVNTQSSTTEITRIPSKLKITISAIPIVTRNDISNNFSLAEYASGALLRADKNKTKRGMW